MKMRPKKAPQTLLRHSNCHSRKFTLILVVSASLWFFASASSCLRAHTPLYFPSARRAKSPGSFCCQTLEGANEVQPRIVLSREQLLGSHVLHCQLRYLPWIRETNNSKNLSACTSMQTLAFGATLSRPSIT